MKCDEADALFVKHGAVFAFQRDGECYFLDQAIPEVDVLAGEEVTPDPKAIFVDCDECCTAADCWYVIEPCPCVEEANSTLIRCDQVDSGAFPVGSCLITNCFVGCGKITAQQVNQVGGACVVDPPQIVSPTPHCGVDACCDSIECCGLFSCGGANWDAAGCPNTIVLMLSMTSWSDTHASCLHCPTVASLPMNRNIGGAQWDSIQTAYCNAQCGTPPCPEQQPWYRVGGATPCGASIVFCNDNITSKRWFYGMAISGPFCNPPDQGDCDNFVPPCEMSGCAGRLPCTCGDPSLCARGISGSSLQACGEITSCPSSTGTFTQNPSPGCNNSVGSVLVL